MYSLRTRITLALLLFVLIAVLNSVLALFFYSRYGAATEALFSGDFVQIDRANELLLEVERLETTGVRLMWTAEVATLEGLFDQLLEHVNLLNQGTFELVRGEPSVDSISLYRATQNVLASATLVFQLRSSQLSGERNDAVPTAADADLNTMHGQMLADLRELTELTVAIREYIYSHGKYKLDEVSRQNRLWVWASWIFAVPAIALTAALVWWFMGRQVLARLSIIGEKLAANTPGKGLSELPVYGRDEIAAMARSIEAFLQTSNQMAQRESQWRDFAISAADWFWEFNREYCFTYISPRFFAITGLAEQALIGRPINSVLRHERIVVPAGELRTARRCALKRMPFRELFIEYHHADATVSYYRLTGTPCLDPHGIFAGFRGTAVDVTEEILMRRQLEAQAIADPLTGVNNRRRLLELCSQEVARWARNPHPMCLAILDIDRLKTINDRHGFMVGDEILVIFASIVRDMVRQPNLFGRLGGEEFGLLIPDADFDSASVLLQRIRTAAQGISPPSAAPGAAPEVRLNIGVVEVGPGDTGIQAVLRRADAALRQAKNPAHRHASGR